MDDMFNGWDTKNGEEGPLWDDPLTFIVSSESGELKFKTFSGWCIPQIGIVLVYPSKRV